MSIKYRKIEVGSPLHAREQALRDDVLRRPLGRALSTGEMEFDLQGHHFVAIEGEAVLGCVGLYPQGGSAVRLRHMAVRPDMQARGIGTGVLRLAEEWARSNGIVRIELHARMTALEFYQRCGYTAEGPVFEEVTVPHRAMWKAID